MIQTVIDLILCSLYVSGYSQKKIQENTSAEIFRVVLDEALDSYKHEIVWELQNDTVEDMENNLERILQWTRDFDK